MFHIIFEGWGFLVFVITFAFSLIANFLTNTVTGSSAYWDAHKWPLGLSLFLSAVACWFLGRILRDRKARTLVDPKTGEEVVLRKAHTFFFIPMIWWGPILATFRVIALGVDFLR